MEFKTYKGIYLNDGEEIVLEGRPSKKALIITWLAIPAFLFVFWVIPLIFPIFRSIFSAKVMNVIRTEEMGIIEYAWDCVFGDIPNVVLVVLAIPFILLALVWVVFCLVLTYRHFQYFVAVTNRRVIGKVKDEEVYSRLELVINVFLTQSLWGKLLNYGTITVATKKGTFDFKSINNPKRITRLLMEYASEYCAN